MRKTIATAVLIAGTTSAAFAADLPARTAPIYAPPLPPVFTWSGGYFGINAGYAFDYSSRFNANGAGAVDPGVVLGVARPGSARVNDDGFTAGGQIGYNYQFGAGSGIVVGIEADANYTDLGKSNYYNTFNNVYTTAIHSDMDFLGTVRGRVGYAFDRFMIYGTGGFAYGDVATRAAFYSNGAAYFSGAHSDIQTGYTYGGGVEYALPTDSFFNFFHSSAVTIKAEYLHYDLGNRSLALGVTPAGAGAGASGTYVERIKTDGDLARIGLNYKF